MLRWRCYKLQLWPRTALTKYDFSLNPPNLICEYVFIRWRRKTLAFRPGFMAPSDRKNDSQSQQFESSFLSILVELFGCGKILHRVLCPNVANVGNDMQYPRIVSTPGSMSLE
jgi:hypothetical protein